MWYIEFNWFEVWLPLPGAGYFPTRDEAEKKIMEWEDYNDGCGVIFLRAVEQLPIAQPSCER